MGGDAGAEFHRAGHVAVLEREPGAPLDSQERE
jgi:hypothetical protein